jgi:hypothetical protein
MEVLFDTGWGRYKRAIDSARFKKRQRIAINKAIKVLANEVTSLVVKRVQTRISPGIADLTKMIKGKTKALIDTGELVNAITNKQLAYNTAFIGIPKNAKGKDGRNLAKIANILHEGATIKVTRRMRIMFRYLWLVGQGKMDQGKLRGNALKIWKRIGGRKRIIKPLSEGTSVIRISARRFIGDVLGSKKVKKMVKDAFFEATGTALKTK